MPSLTRQNAAFSSPPNASSGRRACSKPAGSAIGAGAKPRPRRSTRGAAVHHPHDRIVEPGRDAAVVHQGVIGDRGRAGHAPRRRRSICGASERLPLVITTGRPMRRSASRCSGVVGSMKPSVSSPGATASGRCSGRSARSSTIGASRLCSARSSSSLGVTITADNVEVARHQRERLGLALLALAQPRDGFRIGGVAGELIAAEPLIATISPLLQQGADRIDIVEHRECWSKLTARPSRRTSRAVGPQTWQAIASAWKRRSARIVVFARGTPRTAGTPAIVVARAVIGNAGDDAQPRPAMGAVGERVAEAAFEGIEDLGGAVATDRGVRADFGVPRRRACSRRCGSPPANAAIGALLSIARCAPAAAARVRAGRPESATASSRPATRISTPSPSFSTSPESPSSRAMRHTVGRKPTPCTRPRTRISTATEIGESDAGLQVHAASHKQHAVVARIGDHRRHYRRRQRHRASTDCRRAAKLQRLSPLSANQRWPASRLGGLRRWRARRGRSREGASLRCRRRRACPPATRDAIGHVERRGGRVVGAAVVVDCRASRPGPARASQGAPLRRGRLFQTMIRLVPASATNRRSVATAMPCGQRMPPGPAAVAGAVVALAEIALAEHQIGRRAMDRRNAIPDQHAAVAGIGDEQPAVVDRDAIAPVERVGARQRRRRDWRGPR